jgi:hypothetical protein
MRRRKDWEVMDIFISYSTKDEPIARFLHQHLTNEGMGVFLASASLQPGQKWSQEVLNALRTSPWVLFLASRAACSSPWVQQELGAALISNKTLVPIVWDMPPSELPGWTAHYQTVDFGRASLDEVKSQMTGIAQRIKVNKAQGLLIAGLIFASLFALGSS